MILSDIKRYLEARNQASLTDIATHFDTTPEAVKGMLEIWIRKGKVIRQIPKSACGNSCCKCDQNAIDIYQWHEHAGANPIPLIPANCDQ